MQNRTCHVLVLIKLNSTFWSSLFSLSDCDSYFISNTANSLITMGRNGFVRKCGWICTLQPIGVALSCHSFIPRQIQKKAMAIVSGCACIFAPELYFLCIDSVDTWWNPQNQLVLPNSHLSIYPELSKIMALLNNKTTCECLEEISPIKNNIYFVLFFIKAILKQYCLAAVYVSYRTSKMSIYCFVIWKLLTFGCKRGQVKHLFHKFKLLS